MQAMVEKGGATFEGLKLLLCENPLPPIDEAIAAAQAEAPRGTATRSPTRRRSGGSSPSSNMRVDRWRGTTRPILVDERVTPGQQ
jgi:hypothetical protein